MSAITVKQARAGAVKARREELLTVKEYAAIVRQHEWSVYRRIREGRQTGVVRVGRDIRIDISAT